MIAQHLTVSFISSDLAESELDLIVAFAVIPIGDPMGVDNLILMRTPKFERFLPDEEQGISVSFDGNRADEKGYLREFSLDGDEVEVRTDTHQYFLDLSKTEQDELDQMLETIRKMNFDDSLQTKGV